MTNATRAMTAATSATIACALLIGAATAYAAGPAPSLRLLAGDRSAELRSHNDRVDLSAASVFVAASDGEFRIDLTRPDYGAWRATQINPETGGALRSLPTKSFRGLRGLRRFLRITIADREGRVIRRQIVPFCPNGSRERVDGSGPLDPLYPRGCRSRSPFQRGTVWGIDAGWATAARLGNVRLQPGRYDATIRVTGKYRRMLGIPASDAKLELRLRVKRGREHGPGPVPVPGPVPEPVERSSGGPIPLRAPVVSDPDPATLPDLAALPLWNISLKSRRGRDTLGFAASPWNAGPAPLLVEGYRRSGENVMDAHQFFFDADGDVVGSAPTGRLELDRRRGHHHWHFEQFARFSLRDADGGNVVRSRKQSFCIVPTDAIDLTLPGAEWLPSGRGSNCGGGNSIWMREALPAGWADTYYQSVAGQAFRVTGLPNGRYRLRMTVNPTGELYEVTDANNVVDRVISLRGKPGSRRVSVRPWHGIKD